MQQKSICYRILKVWQHRFYKGYYWVKVTIPFNQNIKKRDFHSFQIFSFFLIVLSKKSTMFL